MSEAPEMADRAVRGGIRQGYELPVGYKRTEVGTIPKDWQVLFVRELFEYQRTASNSRADLDNSGSVAYVHYGDIHTLFKHFIDFTRDNVPRLSAGATVTATGVRDGDLIVADASEDEAGIGKSVEVRNIGKTDAISGLHTLLLRPRVRNRLAAGYRAFLLESAPARRQITRFATGLKVFGVSKQALGDVRLPIPPIREQRTIAKGLSDVDCLLEALEALIVKKREIKQAAMQQLLTGKTRLPSFGGEWATKRLGEIGTFLKGRGIKREEIAHEGYPCIRYGELYTRYENHVSSLVARIPQAVAQMALPISTGDLLFAASGETSDEIGRCAAYLGREQAYAGGDVIVWTLHGQNPVFLGYLMNHPTVTIQKARVGQGDAVVHVSASNLAQVQIELPSMSEQDAIGGILSDMDADITALELRRQKTCAIKRGMMQQLLTGRIRLAEPEATVKDAAPL